MDCLVPIRLVMAGLTLIAPAVAAEPISSKTIRKVACLELARSIRAFAASSLANGECLGVQWSAVPRAAKQATTIALEVMSIRTTVLENPQVLK